METTTAPRPAQRDTRLLLGLAAVPLCLQLVALLTPGYGYFIDEFYYLACTRHLAFGYVDHPPLAVLILAGVRLVLGDSLLAIRLVPFLAGSATVWVTGRLVQRLGGGRFAMVLAGLSIGLMPVLLAMAGFFSMNAFEPLLWTLTMLALVRLIQTGNSKLWLVVGLLVGLGFENKHTLAAFVLALGIGLVATRARRMLLDRWLWLGAAVALGLALPNVLWQVFNGWPSLEFYHNAQLEKNVYSPPLRSLLALIVAVSVFTLPIWATGLAWLLRAREARPLRVLGVTSLVIVAEYLFSGSSRPDRPMAAFPLMIAAGAAALEHWTHRAGVRVLLTTAIVAGSLAMAPLVIPLLPPPTLAGYVKALGLDFEAERGHRSPLPQLLADRTGWDSFIDDVAKVYDSLPFEDRKRAKVYVPDYGHAGALDLWRDRRGLPPVIASQNSYWHWSQGHLDAPVLIAVDHDEGALPEVFGEVRRAGTVSCAYCPSWRSEMAIWVARQPLRPIESVWARARHYE